MKQARRWTIAVVVAAVLLLVGGDRTDPWLWAYLLVFAATTAYAMYSIDENLAQERFNPPEPGADRLALRTVRLVALAHIVVGVLDSRFGWTSVPPALRAVGLAGFALSFRLVIRAMRANRFFSTVVRIQNDRGHRVVDAGPYRVIRHPGYAGMIPAVPMSALALGSWLSLPFALVYSALILRRVIFEDAFLQTHLPGYSLYAARVRSRLLPGVW